jgi:hypothetical protein
LNILAQLQPCWLLGSPYPGRRFCSNAWALSSAFLQSQEICKWLAADKAAPVFGMAGGAKILHEPPARTIPACRDANVDRRTEGSDSAASSHECGGQTPVDVRHRNPAALSV